MKKKKKKPTKKTNKRGAGRPPLPEGQAKSSRILVRCTPSEMAMIDDLAAHNGVDRSDLLRRVLLIGALSPEVRTPGLQNYQRQLFVRWAQGASEEEKAQLKALL
jgi:hypothetical protein